MTVWRKTALMSVCTTLPRLLMRSAVSGWHNYRHVCSCDHRERRDRGETVICTSILANAVIPSAHRYPSIRSKESKPLVAKNKIHKITTSPFPSITKDTFSFFTRPAYLGSNPTYLHRAAGEDPDPRLAQGQSKFGPRSFYSHSIVLIFFFLKIVGIDRSSHLKRFLCPGWSSRLWWSQSHSLKPTEDALKSLHWVGTYAEAAAQWPSVCLACTRLAFSLRHKERWIWANKFPSKIF